MKNKTSTNGILAFTFGFLGISIVGLSNVSKSFEQKGVFPELLYPYCTVILLFIFLVFLFRYLLGQLSYLFKSMLKKQTSAEFFTSWIVILFQFLAIIVMGLTIKSSFHFLITFTFLIVLELSWTFIFDKSTTKKNKLERNSRALMFSILIVQIILLVLREKHPIVTLIVISLLCLLIIIDSINDWYKNESEYLKLLKNDFDVGDSVSDEKN